MSVEVVTFGCRLNGAESETMRGLATEAGLSDAVLVNTCAVTAEAARQARQAVRRAARTQPGATLVVTGCAAQIEPESFAGLPGVAAVLGNAEKMDPEIWRKLRAGTAGGTLVGAIPDGPREGPAASDASAGRVRAFVEVQNGCDHDCTFCTIPRGRGRSRSVTGDQVVEAVRAAVRGGALEVVLTGVDVTAYRDGPEGSRLGELVRTILAEVPDLPRLRLSSLDPVEVDEALIEAFAAEPRLMPHLHLSLQAGDDLVLRRMKRRHRTADAVRLCRDVRRVRPEVAIGADLIAGFPTETDEMFGRSLALVEDCGIAFLHVFPYSARAGTPAARMPQVAAGEIRDRAARLREAGAAALRRHLAAQIGSRPRVLVEGSGLGRTEGFAPVRFTRPPPKGALVEAEIVGETGRELLAA